MIMFTNLKVKKETAIIIKIFYIAVIFMYLVSLLIVVCCYEMFADYSTAFFWFSEIMNAANRVAFIGIFVCVAVEKIA